MCLVCGHTGCGRYKKAHAKDHWYTTGHCLSMEIVSERIWDYSSDLFVHRIMKSDRKTIVLNSSLSGGRVNRTESFDFNFSGIRGNSHMTIWS